MFSSSIWIGSFDIYAIQIRLKYGNVLRVKCASVTYLSNEFADAFSKVVDHLLPFVLGWLAQDGQVDLLGL